MKNKIIGMLKKTMDNVCPVSTANTIVYNFGSILIFIRIYIATNKAHYSLRDMNVVELAAPQQLKWSEVPIISSWSDHLARPHRALRVAHHPSHKAADDQR